MKVLAISIILWSIAAIISPSTFVPGYEETPEMTTAPQSFFGGAEEYATVQQYATPDIPYVEIYAADYDYKNRCRAIHYFTGQMTLSKPFEVHNIEVTQAPGTPGGTTVTGGEGAIEYAMPLTWKIISNYTLTLGQLKELIPPPKDYIKAGWAEERPYAPTANVTFQNCLPPPPRNTPIR